MGLKDLMKTATDGATELVKKELQKKEQEREITKRIATHISAPLTIKTGTIGIICPCFMRQRPEDNLVYFNRDESTLYELVEYTWSGPIYDSITKSQTTGRNTNQTTRKGKSGKIATGALIGNFIVPGVGAVVGAAIGAGGKDKTTAQGTMSSTTNQIQQHAEKPGTAILKFRRISDGVGSIPKFV